MLKDRISILREAAEVLYEVGRAFFG